MVKVESELNDCFVYGIYPQVSHLQTDGSPNSFVISMLLILSKVHWLKFSHERGHIFTDNLWTIHI